MSSVLLTLQRDEALLLPGFLVALQTITEIDFDLRVIKTRFGEPSDYLLAKGRNVDRPGGDDTDLGAVLGLENLILGNVRVLTERRPKNQWVDMNAASIDKDVVSAPLHTADKRKMRTARAWLLVRNRDIRQLVADQWQGAAE